MQSAGNNSDWNVDEKRDSLAIAETTHKASYYKNCAAAFAENAAPIYSYEAAYRPDMDGDDDGIACEPYHGQ